MSEKEESKPRDGVFEKNPSSGIWWIQYFDSEGHRHRERGGRKSSAIMLYQKRRTEVVEGKKLPVLRNVVTITFDEIATDALGYSRSHKISFEDDENRMNYVLEEFGGRSVDSIRPNEIERWLSRMTRQVGKERVPLKAATLNRYRALLSLVFPITVQNGKAHLNPARLVRPRRENNTVIRYFVCAPMRGSKR